MKSLIRLVLGAALAVGSVFVVSAQTTARPAALDPDTLGMYVGFNRSDRQAAVEADLGQPLQWLIMMADRRTPQKMQASVGGQINKPGNLRDRAGEIDIVMTVPLSFGKGSAKTASGRAAIAEKLRETASGAHDASYRKVALTLANGGFDDAVIRLGHEFTGDWYPWSAQGNAAEYIAAYRRVHKVFKGVSKDFRFEWNSARNTWLEYGPAAYPGDRYVDIVGIDIYYEPWKGDKEMTNSFWNRRYEAVLTSHRDFAIRHGKPVAYSEWGAGDIEHPDFIRRMHDWFDRLPDNGAGRLMYQAYFNSPKNIYDFDEHPRNYRTYLELFGANGSRPSPEPAPAPAPAPTVPPTTTPPTTAPPTTTPPTTAPPTTAPPTTAPPTTAPPTTAPPTTPPPAAAPSPAESVVLFDQTTTHRVDQPADLTILPGSGWAIGADRADTSAVLRLDITEKPTDRPVVVQVCAWSDGRRHATCGRVGTFTEPGLHYLQMPAFSEWWQSARWRADRPIEHLRLVVRDEATNSLLATTRCGSACFSGSGDPSLDAPITFDASMIIGSPSPLPASWSDCPAALGDVCAAAGDEPVEPTPGAAPAPVAPVPVAGDATVAVRPAAADEGDKLVFRIVLDRVVDRDVTVTVRSTGVTATSGVDFRPVDTEVVIPAGELRGYVGVRTIADNRREGDETMRLVVDAVDGAAAPARAGIGTISG
ncbi:MAG: glycosyl hydrolase [Actinomycetota bacterium]